MVRTKADSSSRKVVAAKAPRKILAQSSSSSPLSIKDKYSGGNPVRWTPTPSWQKGIGDFFPKKGSSQNTESSSDNDSTSSSQTSSEPSSEIFTLPLEE